MNPAIPISALVGEALFSSISVSVLRAGGLSSLCLLIPGSEEINKQERTRILGEKLKSEFSQHGKNKVTIDDDIEALEAAANNPELSKKERNKAKQKLKGHRKERKKYLLDKLRMIKNNRK